MGLKRRFKREEGSVVGSAKRREARKHEFAKTFVIPVGAKMMRVLTLESLERL